MPPADVTVSAEPYAALPRLTVFVTILPIDVIGLGARDIPVPAPSAATTKCSPVNPLLNCSVNDVVPLVTVSTSVFVLKLAVAPWARSVTSSVSPSANPWIDGA